MFEFKKTRNERVPLDMYDLAIREKQKTEMLTQLSKKIYFIVETYNQNGKFDCEEVLALYSEIESLSEKDKRYVIIQPEFNDLVEKAKQSK